jgi:hypothetical protein
MDGPTGTFREDVGELGRWSLSFRAPNADKHSKERNHVNISAGTRCLA